MKYCYFCEKPVRTALGEDTSKPYICEECRAKYRKEAELREKAQINVANFWNVSREEQDKLRSQNEVSG